MGACPGPENQPYRDAWHAYRQALAAYDPLDPGQPRPEPPGIIPRDGEPVWCPACASKIRQRLAELDDLAALLHAVADGYRAAPADRVPGTPDPPSPSRAADDLDELVSMLTGWEDDYRDKAGLPSAPRRGFLASREATCIAWLGRNLDGLLAYSGATEFGREILQWHREFTASTKAGARTLRKPLRCPSCAMFTLLWTEGDKHVICGNTDCGHILALAEYEAEAERLAKEHRAVALLVTGH